LSSGYRINAAADNAAGLAISEKMRGQIRGLEQASRNIQDGIGMCNIADGALNEVHAILNRVKELAVQASNDTNTDDDRECIDFEIQALFEVIDDIGTDTEYNTMPIFREAGKEYVSGEITASTDGEFFKIMGGDVSSTGYMEEPLDKALLESLPNTGMHNQGDNPYVSVHVNFGNIFGTNKFNDLATKEAGFYINCCTDCCPLQVKFTDENGISKSGSEIKIGLKKEDGSDYADAEEFCKAIVDAGVSGSHVEFACEGSTLYMYDIDNNAWSQSSKQEAYFCDIPGSTSGVTISKFDKFHIQTGSNSNDAILLDFGELSVKQLGMSGNNVLNYNSAQTLLSNVDKANELVSEQRGRIGAYTNRLEHARSNDDNMAENLQAAESRIRDTDMAEEMVKLSKHNILEQATQAILAQANKSTQGILKLLQ